MLVLCRCRRSRTKPYCDGSHVRWESSDAAPTSLDATIDIVADGDLTIFDDRAMCCYSMRCVEGLPSLFRLSADPWIVPGGVPHGEAIATIRACPSGALAFRLASELNDRRNEPETSEIEIAKDGRIT